MYFAAKVWRESRMGEELCLDQLLSKDMTRLSTRRHRHVLPASCFQRVVYRMGFGRAFEPFRHQNLDIKKIKTYKKPAEALAQQQQVDSQA